MQVEDNVYIEEYNRGIAELNSAFSNLRTLEDYTEDEKQSQVESALGSLYQIIEKFSDQNDVQVVSLRSSVNGMKSTYEQNYATANDGAKPSYGTTSEVVSSQGDDIEAEESLSELISSYNQLQHDAMSAYNNMAPLEELTPYKERIEEVLQKMNALDTQTYNSAKSSFEPWLHEYTKLESQADSVGSQERSSMSEEQRLKEFRNLFIANDHAFRAIDLIQFQDEGYRGELETTLKALQELLNPVRSNSSNSTVVRADSDLSHLEAIFNEAVKQSSEMASSVENIDEELAAIKEVFDRENFSLELEEDIYVDDFINSKEEVAEWTVTLKHYKALHPSMLEFLERVRDNTIDGQSQDFLSYYSWFKSLADEMEDLERTALQRWNHPIIIGVKSLAYIGNGLEEELNDQDRVKDFYEGYIRGKQNLDNLVMFESVMYGALQEETQEYVDKYLQFGEILAKAATDSLANERLSEKFYDRPELIELAQKLMQESSREYGEISFIRVIHDISPRTRVDLVEDTHTDRKYFVTQSWEVFNIEFVEKHNEKYYVIFGSFRRNVRVSDAFEKYGQEWIINGINRVENSNEILQENLPQGI